MTLKHIKWKHYISTSAPPLPYDVTFRVFSQDDESHFREISGHKFLLASVSEVFQAQFFGALANDQKVIKIKETTFEAFKFLLHYIYQGIDVTLNDEEDPLGELLEILNLAEKYGMTQLVTEISEVIRTDLVITEENVEEMTEAAEMYSCFKNVSRVLTDKCLSYYKDRKDPMDTEDTEASMMDKEDDTESKETMDTEEPMNKEDNIDSEDPSEDPSSAPSTASSGDNNVGSEDDREKDSQCEEVTCSQSDGGGDEEDSGQDDSICCSERDRLKMSLKNVCWVNFLKSETDLPADVNFQFFEKTQTTDAGVDGGEIRKFVGCIKAHKFLLASCSESFKDSFFNSSNLQTNEIIIEDCSIRAFRIMVDFIYGRFPRLRAGSDICEIFEIENVAEKFRVVGLKEEYKSSMMLYFRHLYKEPKD